MNEMRPSVLPNLLLGAKNNIARGYGNVSLFEVGPEFYGRKPGQQTLIAGGVRVGMTSKKHWSGEARAFDVFDVKADALAAIAAANGPFENAQITLDAPKYYHPGRSGVLRLGKNVLAYFGELHPSITKKQVLNSGFMRLRFILTIFRCRETVRVKPKRNWSFRNSSRWIRIWLLWLTGKCGQLMLSVQPKRQIAMPLPKCGFLTFMRGKICRQIKINCRLSNFSAG